MSKSGPAPKTGVGTRRRKPGERVGLDLPFRNIERGVQGADRFDALEALVVVSHLTDLLQSPRGVGDQRRRIGSRCFIAALASSLAMLSCNSR